MRKVALLFGLLLGGTPLLAPGPAAAAASGADVFAGTCAVCHGPRAEGVAGSFPPLGAQIQAFAQIPAGRDYLVMVVSGGLIGSLTVAGGTYRGAMPAQTALSEADVAAVLNYVASGLGKAKARAHPFDAREVATVRARHPGISGPAALALRPPLSEP
ncbi:MAG: c-type cytochrome [Steroidobacterales bacterium]